MRMLFISSLVLLLTSCSLFEKTPQRVVEGQRAVYQGILLAEENDDKIIDRYIADNKAAVTYHINYVFEPKINAIRENPDLSREEKSEQIAALERDRQAQLDQIFADIEKNAEDMRTQAMKNHRVTKKLVEAIYNYLSTTPIEIDNLEFWVEKLKQIAEQNN
jgi:hypothetical protein